MGKILGFFSFAFAVAFFAAANAQAEYAHHGVVVKPGCGEIVRPKASAKPAPQPVSSFGKSRSSVFLNLAQALSQSKEFKNIQDSVPHSSGSAPGSVSASKRPSATIPTVR